MKQFTAVLVFTLGLAMPGLSVADQGEFCDGFTEGYKTIKGDLVVVPVCPVAPVTPVGSTDHREGLKAGIREAEKR